jgi:glucoamylase
VTESSFYAPGWPGIPARWTSSAKDGVGTSLAPASHVWFTISHGIFNEIYYPEVDQACIRDMGLIVTDGRDFFSEEKRHTRSVVECLSDGVPGYHIENSCEQGRYRIAKDILSDPVRDVVLQRTRFLPLHDTLENYRLYVLLAPHIGNHGGGNTAWIGDYKGVPMLFAERDGNALALACSAPWIQCSCGYVGTSDGWQDLMAHKLLTRTYSRAEKGNVSLTAEVDLKACAGSFILALGFGRNASEAGHRSLASLQDGFDAAQTKYIRQWDEWQQTLPVIKGSGDEHKTYRISTSVLRTHEAKHFPGGMIASLSIPWGSAKGDEDLGGYHLVWPRDLVESAGGLLAAGAREDVHRVLHYLQVTQDADGHWPQNMWLEGTPYWDGIQMDETAFPVLLIDLARREKILDTDHMQRLWPMVRRAAGFLARNGPVTQQDRWEEDPGYSPFTLAVEIAAMLVAADMADLNNETETGTYLRETADAWNANIERWIYVTGTELAGKAGVEGYYVRVAPPEQADASSPAGGFVPIKNRPAGQGTAPATHIISPDALALVRFGLRSPHDTKITNTVKVIDFLLKKETPFGPAWYRYNNDGYGEHEDGSPFDGTGTGRLWPLLVGERAHYELSAGRLQEAELLMRTMMAFANKGRMISEQIWDAPDIPEKELFYGRPSGSAMPLVWAHAEYIKLIRSIRDGQVFDMPPQTVNRYAEGRTESPFTVWRFNHKCRSMAAGKTLRIEVLAPSRIHWSSDGWGTAQDADTRNTGLGIYVVDLPTTGIPAGAAVQFTFYWPEADKWENTDFSVIIQENN